MRLSVHAARACSCGAGLVLPLSPASGGGAARLVAERAAFVEIELHCEEQLDLLDLPDVALHPVRCYACGSVARATHVAVAREGRPVGADTLAGMRAHGRAEIARGEAN